MSTQIKEETIDEAALGTKGKPKDPPPPPPPTDVFKLLKSSKSQSQLLLLLDVLTLAGVIYLCVAFSKKFNENSFNFSS